MFIVCRGEISKDLKSKLRQSLLCIENSSYPKIDSLIIRISSPRADSGD